MSEGDLFRGIFDAPLLTGTQLLVLGAALLALFLYIIVVWPRILARELALELEPMREQVRRIRAIHASRTTDPQQRAWAVWAISQARRFTKRHKINIQYLGISEAELMIIAYHLAHEQENPAPVTVEKEKPFVLDDGDLCQRLGEEDLYDVEVPRKRAAPPPFDPSTLPPPEPKVAPGGGAAGAPAASNEHQQAMTAGGGSSKERRRARRAATRTSRTEKK